MTTINTTVGAGAVKTEKVLSQKAKKNCVRIGDVIGHTITSPDGFKRHTKQGMHRAIEMFAEHHGVSAESLVIRIDSETDGVTIFESFKDGMEGDAMDAVAQIIAVRRVA